MTFSPYKNEDVAQFLRGRSSSPFHICGNEKELEGIDTISLSKLNSVLFYEPEEMIISVQAGISLKELQKILALKGQWIPTLVANESLEQTLGGAVAMDHFHPRSISCGALRTTILGGTFCTTRGELFKSGSRVVKSVAGYDIHRAFCGSQGLFGVILDLTLKVQPLPEMFYRFLAPSDSREMLLKFHPSCIEEFSDKFLVEFSGYKEDIEANRDELRASRINIEELNNENWNIVIKTLIQLRDDVKEKFLSSFLSSDVEEFLKKVQRVFDPEGVLV